MCGGAECCANYRGGAQNDTKVPPNKISYDALDDGYLGVSYKYCNPLSLAKDVSY